MAKKQTAKTIALRKLFESFHQQYPRLFHCFVDFSEAPSAETRASLPLLLHAALTPTRDRLKMVACLPVSSRSALHTFSVFLAPTGEEERYSRGVEQFRELCGAALADQPVEFGMVTGAVGYRGTDGIAWFQRQPDRSGEMIARVYGEVPPVGTKHDANGIRFAVRKLAVSVGDAAAAMADCLAVGKQNRGGRPSSGAAEFAKREQKRRPKATVKEIWAKWRENNPHDPVGLAAFEARLKRAGAK